MAYTIKGDVEISRGLGLAQMTTIQRTAYTPAAVGYMVYDTDLSQVFAWSGTVWQSTSSDSGFITDTISAPTTAGAPTPTEALAAAGTVTDTFITYNGTDVISDLPTYVWYVNNAGSIYEIKKPSSGATIINVVNTIATRDSLTGMAAGDLVRTHFPATTWRYDGTVWAVWDGDDENHYPITYKDADIPADTIDPNVSGRRAGIVLTTAGQTRNIGYPAIGASTTDEITIDIRSGDAGFGGNLGPFTTTLVFDPVYKDPYGNVLGSVALTTTVAQEFTSFNFRRKANTSPVASNEYWLVGGSKFTEFLKGGLAKKGTITSDADAGEGIYNLNASGAAFNFTLPAATGSQARYMFIGENVAINNATIAVQVGENMNGVLNATKALLIDGQVFLATDRATGQWDVKEIGAANTPVPLHYAQRSAWASFINVPLQTVPNISDHGNSTVAAALSNRLDVSTAMTSSTSGITVGTNDFTITQDGRYRISFEVEVEDATPSASYGTVVQVVKNGTLLTKAKARPSNSDTNSQYITTNPNGVISVDLLAGDVIDFRIASMNASVSKDITGYNIDIAQEASSTVIDVNATTITNANGVIGDSLVSNANGTATWTSFNVPALGTEILVPHRQFLGKPVYMWVVDLINGASAVGPLGVDQVVELNQIGATGDPSIASSFVTAESSASADFSVQYNTNGSFIMHPSATGYDSARATLYYTKI